MSNANFFETKPIGHSQILSDRRKFPGPNGRMTTRKGCRPLTDDEVKKLSSHYDKAICNDPGNTKLRDYTLIMFGFYVGSRISETLSLSVKDVWQHGRVSSSVYFKRQNTKGKRAGRTGVINPECQELLTNYIRHYQLDQTPEAGLWFSKRGCLKRSMASKIMSDVFHDVLEFDGKVATHSARKTFARKGYEKLHDSLLDLKECLGHSSLDSTLSYISHNNEKVNDFLDNLSYV